MMMYFFVSYFHLSTKKEQKRSLIFWWFFSSISCQQQQNYCIISMYQYYSDRNMYSRSSLKFFAKIVELLSNFSVFVIFLSLKKKKKNMEVLLFTTNSIFFQFGTKMMKNFLWKFSNSHSLTHKGFFTVRRPIRIEIFLTKKQGEKQLVCQE